MQHADARWTEGLLHQTVASPLRATAWRDRDATRLNSTDFAILVPRVERHGLRQSLQQIGNVRRLVPDTFADSNSHRPSMPRLLKRMFAAAITATVTGCAVYTPAGSVVVDPNVGSSGGGFCPPGQAKKGNC